MNQHVKRAKINWWMVSTLILLGVVIGFGASQIPYIKNSIGLGENAAVIQPAPSPRQPPARQVPQAVTLSADQTASLTDDDPVFGDANAPVTIVEFTDFQCPYCARFLRSSFPQIEENYIKTGKARFIIRDFPLDFHAQSQLASQAAQCAHEQGKFRQMHDVIFDEQTSWSGNGNAADLMKDYAKRIELNTKQFDECLSGGKYVSEVRKDLIDGATLGVNGTPAFFINGKPFSGAMPYDLVFQPILEAELVGKQWEIQYDASGIPSVKVY